jgi:hypothetical protein
MTKQVCFTLHHWKKFQCKIKQFESEFSWFLLILVNRAYCIILFTILVFSRRRGGAQLFVFLFGFFLYNLQILWGFKINSECWYVVGIAVFFCSIKISFIFFFVCFRGVSKHNTEQQCFFFMLSSTVDLCK